MINDVKPVSAEIRKPVGASIREPLSRVAGDSHSNTP